MNEKEQAERIWDHVVNKPVGYRIRTDEPKALHDLLVKVRTESADSRLFQFTLQVQGDEVWIVRSKALPEVKTEGEFQPLEE